MSVKNDVSVKQDTSMNMIYDEIVNMYNYLWNNINNSNIIENFELPSLMDRDIVGFVKLVEIAKENDIDITFTIYDLHNIVSSFYLKAVELTAEQKFNRKKVLTNIQTILSKYTNPEVLKFKIDKFIFEQTSKSNISQTPEQIQSTNYFKKQAHPGLMLVLNTTNLLLKEINDIENPIVCPTCEICSTCEICPTCKICPTCEICPICPIDYTNYYLITIVLLIILIIYLLSKSKP